MTPRMMALAGIVLASCTMAQPLATLAQGTATTPAPRQPTQAQAAQQERMRACNTDASGRNLTGDARRTFMSECLAGREPAASPGMMSQQDRMRNCNADASTRKLAGDARRSFMSHCLSDNAPAAAPAQPAR